MKKTLILILIVLFAWSCGNVNETEGNSKINIVATTGMIADVVRNIGKDSVTVNALMGPGVDPHLYKATQGDLGRLRGADVIFYNGLHLEGKMGEVFEKLERIKTVVPVARGIETNMLIDNPIFQGSHDPHIWFDVSMWISTIQEVTSTLVKADPESKVYYEQNALTYEKKLKDLHDWVTVEIQKIPKDKRLMVTAHDAFSYFGRAYDIEVRGLQGISTLSEFGLKDRVDLVNFIVGRKVKAVFVETSVSEKNINAIVEGCRQKGHNVVVGGNLFSDAMGADGTPAGNYIGMVKANVNTIVGALR